MSLFIRDGRKELPGLNTAALPDLIFTVLFFFMIATHMREMPHMVSYQVPDGTELTRLTRQTPELYVFVGYPTGASGRAAMGGDMAVQVNDKLVRREELSALLSDAADKVPMPQSAEEMGGDGMEESQLVVNLRADRQAPMQLVTDIKQAMRQAGVLRISYSANQK